MSAPIKRLTVEHVSREGSAGGTNDVAERAIDLGFELAQAILDKPALLDRIPDRAVLALLPSDDPEVARANAELGNFYSHRGYRVERWLLPELRKQTRYEFTIDLRDERWGAEPRPELDGRTARELRDFLAQVVQESKEGRRIGLAFENVVVLNGVRISIEDEIEPGLYRCVAIDAVPE